MAKQALTAAIYWLTVNFAFGEETKTVAAIIVPDSQSEESAPVLYHNLPAVYASAAPHAAFSFHAPAFATPPVTNNAAFRNLKDSYGQFVQGPHSIAYKSAFPQQYIQLQELPAHLAQPLLAHSNLHFKQTIPHFSGGHPVRIHHQHVNKNRGGDVFGDKIRNFVPSRLEVFRIPTQHSAQHRFNKHPSQQPSLSTIHENLPPYQRIQEKPQSQSQVTHQSLREPKQTQSNEQSIEQSNHIQAAPAQTSITAIVNGKKTIIKLDTKPPLPLLDLNLLEPLTFDNPLVPQIQNYLPRINSATYHKLPDFNVAQQKGKQEGQKTQSYDGDVIVGKPKKHSQKKKYKPPVHNPESAKIPSLDGVPEIVYEINKPGHREIINEQVISYNKETTSKPITVSYHMVSHKEPETYTFSHSAKEPLHVKHVEYDSDKGTNPPKELIYHIPAGEQKGQEDIEDVPNDNSRENYDSGESNSNDGDQDDHEEPYDNNEDIPAQNHNLSSQKHQDHKDSSDHHQHREHKESQSQFPNQSENLNDAPRPRHYSHNVHPNKYSTYGSKTPSSHSVHLDNYQGESPKQTNYHSSHEAKPEIYIYDNSSPNKGYYDSLPSYLLPPEHRNEEQQFKQNSRPQPGSNNNPSHYTQHANARGPSNQFQPIFFDFPQVIHLEPLQQEYAAIKVDPVQHIQEGAPKPHSKFDLQKNTNNKQERQEKDHSLGDQPLRNIQQKSKHIIIKEKEETPNEMHSLAEQLMEQMVDQEENSEADFEKAYKESAFGFPGYEQSVVDLEKDIYNPESYGVAKYHNDYDIEINPFEQYTKGNEYPKSSRADYKDARDNMQKNYFLDFSISKPESFTDRYKSKENYFKIYDKHRPKKFFGSGPDDKEKKKEKIVFSPSFVFPTKSKQKQHYSEYIVPKKHQYVSPKERDSTPYSSQPYHKHKTFFVEPQFQYGFVPIVAPLALDSELAAMASNDSPETQTSGNPAVRKKVYKENWYIKKTSTSGVKPS